MRLVGRLAVELIDHLFDLAQIQQVAGAAREAHVEFARRQLAAFGRPQAFEAALYHDDLEMAAGEVLLGQVCTAGNQTSADVQVGDAFEQRVELHDAQALAKIGFEQRSAISGGKRIRAVKLDLGDVKTTAVRRQQKKAVMLLSHQTGVN